jgi:YbbR domain-containing protein
LAVILWFQVTGEQNPEIQRVISGIPVVYTNPEQGLMIMEKKPETVSVKVQGLRADLGKLSKDDFSATADLKGGAVGWGQFPLIVKAKNDGVQLIEYPTEVSVRLDTNTNRQMDVQIHLIGVLGDDFANKQPVVRPSQVAIQGPKSRLDLVAQVSGDLDMTGATGEIKRSVPIKAVDAQGLEVGGVTVKPNVVDVTVSVVSLPPGKLVPIKAKVTGDPAPGYHLVSVTAEPGEVKLRGGADLLSGVESTTAQSFSIAGVKGIVSQDVEVVLPPGLSMAEPRTVRVTAVIEEDAGDRTIAGVPVKIGGLAGGLSASVAPSGVSITVRGPKSLLSGLAAKDIAASVNAKGYSPGSYSLAIDVTVPNGFTVVQKDPGTVGVTIK